MVSWTLTTSGAAISKAGVYANKKIIASGATLAVFCDEAEGIINARTRKDWVTGYAAVTTNFKGILNDAAANLVACKIIRYDSSNYPDANYATNLITELNDKTETAIKELKEEKVKEEMD